MTTAFGSVLPQTRTQIDRLRRRVDKTVLRIQGRLDHPNVDRFTPWIISSLLFAVLLVLALARNHSVDMGADLASYIQGTWLIGEGFKPETALVGGNLLAEQAAVIIYPLAFLLRFLPRATTLLVIQSLAIALTVVPLWRLARGIGRLRVGVTTAVAFAFCVYASVHNVNLAGFHPAVLALPALVAAVRYGLEGHRYRYMASVIMVLVSRADLGLAIAGLGVLLMFEGRRRWGIGTVFVGLFWMMIAIFVIQPALAEGLYPHVDAFAGFGDTPFDILWGIVSHPATFLDAVFSEANFRTVVTLFAPVLFLPLVAPRYLIPVVPLYALYLAADVPVGRLSEASQTVPMTAFIFVATIFALKRSGQVLVERVSVDKRVVVALVLTATVFFVRDAVSSPYEQPWLWAEQQQSDVVLLEQTAMIPPDAPVRASARALPLLAERVGLYELDTSGVDARSQDIDATVADVDWIIFDPQAAPNWDSLDAQIFVSALGNRGYQPVFDGWVKDANGERLKDADDREIFVGILVFEYTGVQQTLPVG